MVFGLITTVLKTENGKSVTEQLPISHTVLVVAVSTIIMKVMIVVMNRAIVAEILSRFPKLNCLKESTISRKLKMSI